MTVPRTTHRYYFAAMFAHHAEMREHRNELVAALPDVDVTSQWIDLHGGTEPNPATAAQLNTHPEQWGTFAHADVADIIGSDVLVLFTGGGGRGGRHTEFGYALALSDIYHDMRLVIVGERENIFHTLPHVEVYPTWTEFLTAETHR